MSNKIQVKRGTKDPGTILDIGELGYDSTNKVFYVGNGVDIQPTKFISNTDIVNTYLSKTDASKTYLPFSGGTLTGPITFANSSSNALKAHYLSAGGGYSVNTGRLGLKILALDQADAQMGMGVDLTGGPYELTIATSRVRDNQASKIVFATHNTETADYKALASLYASGAATPIVTFNVAGTIQENGTSLSDKYALKTSIPTVPSITTGSTNGTIKVGSIDVAVKGLGSAAYTASTAYLPINAAAASANKVNSSLTIKLNSGSVEGSNLFTFNGSGAKSINITPSSIGAIAENKIRQELWTGSWSSKKQTIPNSDKYSIFLICLDGVGTPIIAAKYDNYIRGIGGHRLDSGNLIMYQFTGTFSGTTWTMDSCTSVTHTSTGHGDHSNRIVKRVYGVL